MKSFNPALLIAGPCISVYKGLGFYSKADVPVTPKEDLTDIPTSAYGPVGEIGTNQLFEIKMTPAGQLDVLDVLFPPHLRNFATGLLVHKTQDVGTFSTVTGVVTKAAHGWRDKAQVRLDTNGVMPGNWSKATLYYLHALTTGTYTLHTTEVDAGTGANPVIPSSAGTGRLRIIEQESLLIWSINEQKGYLFHNAAITGIPGITSASTETAVKEVTFTCYRKHAADPATDTEAFYTPTTTAPTVAFDPDAIVIAPKTVKWGATAPWSEMPTEKGVEIDWGVSLEPVRDDVGGIVSHRITAIVPTAKARPRNITEDDILAKRNFQGAGAGNGRRITAGDNLIIEGEGLYIILYGVTLTDSPYGYDGKDDRVRDFTWKALRKFVSSVPQPLYYIGAAAP